MSNKAKYLKACMNQSIDWLKASATNPNKYMTKTDILLHYVAIRRKGGL